LRLGDCPGRVLTALGLGHDDGRRLQGPQLPQERPDVGFVVDDRDAQRGPRLQFAHLFVLPGHDTA
jgi:hypothetical protein